MCCKREVRPCKLIISFVTFVICAFDVTVDWYGFYQFITNRDQIHEYDNELTIALGALCGFATVIFFIEVFNAIRACRLYTHGGRYDDVDDAEQPIQRLYDVITFFQILLQDAPVTVLLTMAYVYGSCSLYTPVFRDTFTANLMLAGACASAVWTVFVVMLDWCCGCCGGSKGCGWQCCCCCCRALRSSVALMVIGFAIFLFYLFTGQTDILDPNCILAT